MTLNWIKIGIICGLIVSFIYPSLQFISDLVTGIIFAVLMGLLLSLASVGLYYFIATHKKSIKIWNELNKHGAQNKSSILKDTKLSTYDFYVGVGWLARENKIYQDTGVYKLGNTNLTDEIGENAGKIWRLLDSYGQANISSIQRLTKISINNAYSAIGWLSRENKIKFLYKNKQMYYKLT